MTDRLPNPEHVSAETKPVRFVSLFAGIGGFDKAFEDAGMTCLAHVELDPKCRAILKRQFPNTRSHDDISTFNPRRAELPADVVCGGSPCQDLSVAGLREGLGGQRSGLFHQMVRVCKRLQPRFVVWENVDGAFSSQGGRDFQSVLRAFTGLTVEIPEDGWGNGGFVRSPFACRWNVAWRVFDSQYFGVPQRRRRVFLVGSLGDERCLEILFEPESVRGDSPPRRESRERVAPTLASRTRGGGGLGTDFDCGGGLIPETQCAVVANDGVCHQAKGGDPTTDNYVAQSFKASHFTRGKDGAPSDIAPPLSADADKGDQDTLVTVPTLTSNGDAHSGYRDDSGLVACFDERQVTSKANRSQCLPHVAGTSHSSPHAIAYALQGGGKTSQNPEGSTIKEECSFTLNRIDVHGVAHGQAVRRLTPKECLRLQAFPDDWCDVPGQSDSATYKQAGNAVTVSVVYFIAQRIVSAFTNNPR